MTATATRVRTTVRPTLGVAMVVASGVLFAVNGTVSKLILETGVDASRLTLLRAAGAWAGLTVIAVATRPGIARLRIRREELPLLITYGLAGFFLVPMLYFVAIRRLPVGIALLFEYTAPLLVALWARFGWRQQVKPRLWYGLAGNLVGLACITQFWHASLRLDAVGVLAGLGAAGLLCFYYVLGARGVASRDTVSLTWWAFGISALAGLTAAMFRTGGLFPIGVLGHESHGVPVWVLAIYLVLGGSIASYLLVAAALRHLPPTSVGIIGMVEPVIAAGVAWLVLDERLSVPQLIGGVLVLIGVGVAETARTAGPADAPEILPTQVRVRGSDPGARLGPGPVPQAGPGPGPQAGPEPSRGLPAGCARMTPCTRTYAPSRTPSPRRTQSTAPASRVPSGCCPKP